MLSKLKAIEDRFEALVSQLEDPATYADPDLLRRLTKEQKEAPAPSREVVPRDQQKSRFTDDELAILAAASKAALTADEVVEKTQIPAKRVLSALTMLQLQGAVEERPGRRYYALVELEA